MKRLNIKELVMNHRWKFASGIILVAGINMLQIYIPGIIGDVIDLLEAGTLTGQGLLEKGGIIMALALGAFLCRFLSRIQLIGASTAVDYDIRDGMFKHLLKLSMRYFNRHNVGDLMALATNDLRAVRFAFSRGLMIVTDVIILFILATVKMSNVNLQLTLTAMIPFPIMLLTILFFGPLLRKKFTKVQESFADLTRQAQENISAIRVIRAFVGGDHENKRFGKLNNQNFKANMDMVKIHGLFHPLIGFIGAISTLILLIVGGRLVINGTITTGQFVACTIYIGMLVRPIAMIGMLINFLQRGKASWLRIQELFTEEPDIVDNVTEEDFIAENNMEQGEKLDGRIEFRNVNFSYEDNGVLALDNVNLDIPKGTMVGIIGRIGSGKTTIANLIMRLYDSLDKGSVLIDGHNIEEIPMSILRNSIGYVPQDHFLFSETIENNIDFNLEQKGFGEVQNAAEISQIHESILEFTDQYQAKLGEKGVNISGGQKQRISIARAIIRNPSILILDDCLSAVDTATEEKILNSLVPFMKDRTTIIIGHRISSMRHADVIVVMDEGQIAEMGSHEELMELDNLYASIFRKQQLEHHIETA